MSLAAAMVFSAASLLIADDTEDPIDPGSFGPMSSTVVVGGSELDAGYDLGLEIDVKDNLDPVIIASATMDDSGAQEDPLYLDTEDSDAPEDPLDPDASE